MNITLDDGRTELWQWDTGRKIVVDDKSVSEVHYSKYSSTQAITRKVIDGKAEIPNFLLQDTHAVTVYAYSGSIENGYTMAEKTFDVAKKPKPANYVETEEDKAILAKLKAEIGDLTSLQTNAKDNLVATINEVAESGGIFEINAESGSLISDYVYQVTLDKTYDEIDAAFNSGKTQIVILDNRYRFPVIDTATGYTFGAFLQMGPDMYGFCCVYISNREEGILKLPMADDATLLQFAEHVETTITELTSKIESSTILQSTTPNSTKKFKITVDDTGSLSAAEVTTS